MGSFDRVYSTKKGDGIIVVGRANTGLEALFHEFNQELSDFYFKEGLIAVTPRFDSDERQYLLPIYDPETLDIRMRLIHNEEDPRTIMGMETLIVPPTAIGNVSLRVLPSRTYHRYVKDWDFPHAPHETSYECLLAYFNMDGREEESAEKYSGRLCRGFYRVMEKKCGE